MGHVETHTSDDGLLKLIVRRDDDGDTAVGFEGFPWHTHADILTSCSVLSEAVALRQFIEDVLGNRAVIAVCRVGGEARDVWVTNDPASELKYQRRDETIEFRYWRGRRAGE